MTLQEDLTLSKTDATLAPLQSNGAGTSDPKGRTLRLLRA
jgi:hypothetical protein